VIEIFALLAEAREELRACAPHSAAHLLLRIDDVLLAELSKPGNPDPMATLQVVR
jgi:hypothetical protein